MSRKFNGTSDCMQSSANVSYGGGNKISFAFWYNRSVAYAATDQLICESSAASASNTGRFILNSGVSGGLGTPNFEFNVNCGSSNFADFYFTQPSVGGWHQFVITIDMSGGTSVATAYVDGVSQTVTVISNHVTTLVSDVVNLMCRNQASLFNSGMLAEFAIYTGILTSADAKLLGGGVVANSAALSLTPVAYLRNCGSSSPEPDQETSSWNWTVTGTTQSPQPITGCGKNTFSYVQEVAGSTTGVGVNVSTATIATPTKRSLLVVKSYIACASGTTVTGLTVSDGTNTFTLTPNSIATYVNNSNNNNANVALSYILLADSSGSHNTITSTWTTSGSGAQFGFTEVWEFSYTGSAVFDTDVKYTDGTFSTVSNPITVPSITPAGAGELLVATFNVDAGAENFVNAPWTNPASIGDGGYILSCSAGSTAASFNDTTTPDSVVVLIAAFKNPIQLLQNASNTAGNGASSLVVTLSATAAGSCLVVGISHFSASTITSVQDSAGNNYILRVNRDDSNLHEAIYALNNLAAGITSITINFSPVFGSSSSMGACVLEYSGVSGFGQITGTTQTANTFSTNFSIQAAGNLIVSAIGLAGGGTTYTATNGTTEMNVSGASERAVVSYNSGGSIGANVTNSGNLNASVQSSACSLELSTIPINFVQSVVNSTASASSLTGLLPFSSIAGNTLLVFVRSGAGATDSFSVSDNNSNPYHEDRFQTIALDGDEAALFRTSGIAITPNNPITVTVSVSNGPASIRLIVAEYSGMSTTPLDQVHSANQNTGGGPYTPNSGNVTPSVSGEMVVGCLSLGSIPGGCTINAGSGFLMMVQETDSNSSSPASNVLNLEQQYITSLSPIAATFAFATGTQDETATFIATYKAPAVAGVFVPVGFASADFYGGRTQVRPRSEFIA